MLNSAFLVTFLSSSWHKLIVERFLSALIDILKQKKSIPHYSQQLCFSKERTLTEFAPVLKDCFLSPIIQGYDAAVTLSNIQKIT